jgi:hypothetical protein
MFARGTSASEKTDKCLDDDKGRKPADEGASVLQSVSTQSDHLKKQPIGRGRRKKARRGNQALHSLMF